MLEDQAHITPDKKPAENVSTMPIAIIINRQGIVKFITKKLASLLGYSVNELLGIDAIELFSDKTEVEDRRTQLDFLYKQESLVGSFTIALKSRLEGLVEFRFNILKLDSQNGSDEDIALVGDDLRHTRLVKADLSNEQKQVEEILNSSREFVITIDHNEELSTVNEVSRQVLGCKPGMSLREILDPNDVKHTTSFLNSLSKISSTSNINLVLLHPISRKRFYLAGAVSSNVANGKLLNFRLILQDITERTKSEKARDLYYSIAHHSIHSRNLEDLYYNIHKELKAVVECENLYIALTEEEGDELFVTFPYYQEANLPGKERSKRKFGKGITEYLISGRNPQIFTKNDLINLTKAGKIQIHGPVPEVWLGVPLKVKNRVIGAIAIQSYHSESFYSSRDLKLLDFASSQIAMAIDMIRTQEKLIGQTAKLNSIIESGSHLIWTVNTELELTSFNRNYFDAIINNYDTLPTIQEGSNNDERDYPSFWEDKYREAFQGKQLNFEIELKDNEGNDVWKEIYLNPIYLEGGKIEEISGIANDITEKKKSAQALEESEEKFRNIFESFQDVYFRCQMEGKIMMVSPSVEALTGRKPEDVLGADIAGFLNDKQRAIDLQMQLLKDREIQNVEVTINYPENSHTECICNLRLIHDSQTGEDLIEGVVRDVTLLKLTNRELIEAKDIAEESLIVKEQFLANMSHEIRTPLNGIIGVVDLLGHTDLEKDQKSYLKTIKSSSETLLNILNDILDLSKIEAGKMQLYIEPLSTEKLVKKIRSLFTARASSKLIKLKFHVSKNLPKVIEADRMRLIQVISNLLANSIKFTPRGGSIDLGFEVKKETKKDVIIRVDVRDSGIGIKSEDVEKLFNNFTQLDASTTKAYEGTGLGLSIAKQLVELMGGKIGVSSIPGLGSTFWFTFKANKSNREIVVKPKKARRGKGLIRFKDITPKILVVDDNLVNREVAGEILKKSGCQVDMAANGLEAVYKAKSSAYDIIFMDIQMPEMDGIEATAQIKKQNHNTPVIVAMTAYSMKDDEQRFLEAGLDEYMAKPIRANQIINKVEGLISGEKNPTDTIKEPVQSLQIINQEVLAQLAKFGGKAMIISALEDFNEEVTGQLKECEKSYKAKDYKTIQKHLHTLKGSAGTLGIERVAEVAKNTEAAMKLEDYTKLSQGLKELRDSFAEFKENFTNIISNYL